tara:strand:- start:229 stop:363 length:135 start_codon:yes stop_codon:yes gene_type:complete
MTTSDGFTGASFLPQPYKEKDDKNKTTRSMTLKFIFPIPLKIFF